MKVKIELEDLEALEMVTMLTAVSTEMEEKGNENHLLAGALEALKDRVFNALLNQVPYDRVKEITKR